jgi:hypothetical protein
LILRRARATVSRQAQFAREDVMNSNAVLMRRLVILGIVSLVFLAGCGGGAGSALNNPPPPVNNPPSAPNLGPPAVTLLIGDTPPAGVTVLSFGVTVTGAVLQPGDVSLVSAPIRVELNHLQVDPALLGRTPVVPGTYTSLTVSFANPELTILNDTRAAIGTCANGAICELRPSLAASSVSFSGPPLPLAASTNSALNLMLDFDLESSTPQGLATINPALTLTVQQGGTLEHFKDVFGEVKSLIENSQGLPIGPVLPEEVANSATLQTDMGPLSITFQLVDVQFEGFGAVGCQDQNIAFSCLRVGQFWDADLLLFPDGLLETQTIRLKPGNEQELEGLVVAIDSPSQFDIVVLVELPDVAGVDLGNLVRVNLLCGATFEVVDTNLTASCLLFSSPSDLLVGQVVTVRLQSAPSGIPFALTTDRVRLKSGAFTARVKSILNATDFVVDNLPGNFSSAQIQVRTNAQTGFLGISGVGALNVGDTVSLSGFLLKTASDPVLLAERVRKR